MAMEYDRFALVRFDGDPAKIEADARQIVDQVITIFDDKHTLGGLAAIAKVVSIDEPLPSTVNDVPFYWIPFLIDIYGENLMPKKKRKVETVEQPVEEVQPTETSWGGLFEGL